MKLLPPMVIKVLMPGRKLLLQSMLLLRSADNSTLLEPLTTSHRYLKWNDRPNWVLPHQFGLSW